ncbi:hypothetical protein [Streptomyces sp. NPDC042319]|uniref:MmyB family transcriptional regulator n=1 Tax=Streptomyces sp. NPDC042319 TaxID=3154332 RepID=UPI0034098D34
MPGAETAGPEEVRRPVRLLLDQIVRNPAYVVGRWLDLLATNRLADLLLADFPRLPQHERNLARQLFRNPAMRTLFQDWRGIAVDAVGFLRMSTGTYPGDPRTTALITELACHSPEFRKLWSAHHVHRNPHGVRRLRHPRVGPLPLTHESFALPGDPGQHLVTYQAEPGSPSEHALRALTAE